MGNALAKAEPREKIGLVLSGGAARGLAHIGVLRAIEEQNITVDAVVGTSMGAVIGGLYAAGYSVDEIEEIATKLDWAYALTDDPKRDQLPFKRKQDDFDFMVKNRLTLKDGEIRFPTGLLQGQQLNLVLNHLFAPVPTNKSFDDLAIPFRAVATDMATGDEVVLDSGNLAQAVKASMSIPGLLAPLDLDGRLLVDGGIANNIPISVVKSMGVDRVIAIDIGAPLYKKEEISSVFSVMDQLTNFLTRKNSAVQIGLLGERDLLLQPDLQDISSVDFSKGRQAIDIGYEYASQNADALAALGNIQPGQRQNIDLDAKPMISFIHLKNRSPIADRVVRKKIRQQRGKAFDQSLIDEDITDIYALGYFDLVNYALVTRDGQTGLLVKTKDKYWGADNIQLGFSLANDFDGDDSHDIAASFRKNAINRLGAEWFSRAQIGETMQFTTDFYQPLDYSQRWFVEPSYAFEAENIEFIQDGDELGEFRVRRHTVGFSLGRALSNKAELRIGIERSQGRASARVGPPELNTIEFNDGNYFAKFSYDTLDSIFFPSEGSRFELSYAISDKDIGADQDFKSLRFNGLQAFGWGPNRFVFGGELLRADDLTAEPQYSEGLGGFLRLSGLQPNAIVGQNLALARGVYYRRISQPSSLPLDLPLYLGGSLEAGSTWLANESFDLDEQIYSGSLFFGMDTPLGPLYLAYGRSEAGEQSFNLFLGQIF
ncbi:MAG: patatin-like phospholipase family protein [Pseudomonadales bacterium]